jgi:protein-tyrosine phosphatase
MSRQRARQIRREDLIEFDLILAMDRENLAELQRRAPTEGRERVRLFLEFADEPDVDEVPDPYYGGDEGFERVLDLTESAARGLLDYLMNQSSRPGPRV